MKSVKALILTAALLSAGQVRAQVVVNPGGGGASLPTNGQGAWMQSANTTVTLFGTDRTFEPVIWNGNVTVVSDDPELNYIGTVNNVVFSPSNDANAHYPMGHLIATTTAGDHGGDGILGMRIILDDATTHTNTFDANPYSTGLSVEANVSHHTIGGLTGQYLSVSNYSDGGIGLGVVTQSMVGHQVSVNYYLPDDATFETPLPVVYGVAVTTGYSGGGEDPPYAGLAYAFYAGSSNYPERYSFYADQGSGPAIFRDGSQSSIVSFEEAATLAIEDNAISPTGSVTHVGTGALATITVPTADNIGKASIAVVGRVLTMVWDGAKWWPSY